MVRKSRVPVLALPVPTYVSDSEQASIKEHHDAHEHEEEAKGGQSDADFLSV